MRFPRLLRLAGRAALLAGSILIFTHTASAAATFSGSGYGAYAAALDQFSEQSGSTPAQGSSSTSIQTDLFPSGGDLVPTPTTIPATASAFAAAGPATGDGNLLEIRSYGHTDSHGQTVGASSPWPDTQTNAGWTGVVATVSGPTGSTLPSTIRLEFQATYSPPSSLTPWGIQSSVFSPQELTLINHYGGGNDLNLVNAGTALQPGEAPVKLTSAGLLQGNFHIDLSLSPSGVSQPFGLALASNLPVMLYMGQSLTNSNFMSVSLAGITLPDGSSLDSQGYSVNFQSGLPYDPNPVPEPATWVMWGLVAAGYGLRVQRRSR